MKSKTIFSIDVEPDLHDKKDRSINEGLKKLKEISDKNNIKPVLFVVGSLIPKHSSLFKELKQEGWEISCHGYSHKRFDEMTYEEKEEEIKKCISVWKKYLNSKPKGFRAPQHSIDSQTLDLLEKYKFKYDSSYSPLNFLQLIFFPKKFTHWLKIAFSPLNVYKIRPNLEEIPVSSLLIPNVSLTFRILPKILLRFYFWLIKLFYKRPVFYAHSWDFIELPRSRIDRKFSHKKFIDKLNYLMSLENENPRTH